MSPSVEEDRGAAAVAGGGFLLFVGRTGCEVAVPFRSTSCCDF